MRTATLTLTLALALCAGHAHAGFTSPTLVLTSAVGNVAPAGRSLAVGGEFDFPNVVQVGYPLSLVVFQGSHFVRYPAAGTPVAGTSALLADGALAESEVAAFVASGTPVAPPVRVVSITAGGLRVVLPAAFAAGSATVVLVATIPEGAVLSNPVNVVLP
jgi:hypothetical protein